MLLRSLARYPVSDACDREETNGMMNYDDYNHPEAILEAIARGIAGARSQPPPDESIDVDRYVAWCAVQELRLAGWRVTPIKS